MAHFLPLRCTLYPSMVRRRDVLCTVQLWQLHFRGISTPQIRTIISTESGSSWKQTALYNRSFPVSFKDNERLPFVQLLLPSQLINIDKFYRRRRCHGNRFSSSVRLTVFRRFHLNRWSLWVSISTNFVEVSAAGGDSHDFLWSRMQKISNLSALNQC